MIKSNTKPMLTPIKYIRSKTAMFSLRFLLVLKSNKIPMPLPVKRPDNIMPIVIKPFKYNSVIRTLPAQLGIIPIKLDRKYEKIL